MPLLAPLQKYAERGAYGDLELYASRGLFVGEPPLLTGGSQRKLRGKLVYPIAIKGRLKCRK